MLEFPIQGYISSIDIVVNATVNTYNGKESKLASSHHIDIELGEENTNFMDLYLSNKGGNYFIKVLGANGEKMDGLELSV